MITTIHAKDTFLNNSDWGFSIFPEGSMPIPVSNYIMPPKYVSMPLI